MQRLISCFLVILCLFPFVLVNLCISNVIFMYLSFAFHLYLMISCTSRVFLEKMLVRVTANLCLDNFKLISHVFLLFF